MRTESDRCCWLKETDLLKSAVLRDELVPAGAFLLAMQLSELQRAVADSPHFQCLIEPVGIGSPSQLDRISVCVDTEILGKWKYNLTSKHWCK